MICDCFASSLTRNISSIAWGQFLIEQIRGVTTVFDNNFTQCYYPQVS